MSKPTETRRERVVDFFVKFGYIIIDYGRESSGEEIDT